MSTGLVLNTNIDSLIAQNSLTTSGNQLTTALQQLSSGLQINTAADNAAGYAIAQGMTSQVNGLNQAINNANDGVSLTQTAQGALTEITNDLQTMRDLAVQSLNATNSSQDRVDLNQQFQQLMQDMQQVASTASFNGVNLLDGSFASQQFQIGANVGNTITVQNISSVETSAIGQTYNATVSSSGPTLSSALTAGQLVINNVSVGATSSDGVSYSGGSYSAIAVANAINAAGISGVTATANQTTATAGAAAASAGGTLAAGDLVINGVNITGTSSSATQTEGLINAQSSLTGVSATINGSGDIVLTAVDGRNITVTATANGTTVAGFSTGTSTSEGNVTLNSNGVTASAAAIDINTAPTGSGFTAGTTSATLNSNTVNTSDVLTISSSNQALYTIDAALQQVAAVGAQLGAYQNRFQAAISGLQTDATNLSAAKSQIVDTNYAQATSDLSKAQILQQASTAMVAQANTIPQQILTLLQKLP